jgi:hypothetical protein
MICLYCYSCLGAEISEQWRHKGERDDQKKTLGSKNFFMSLVGMWMKRCFVRARGFVRRKYEREQWGTGQEKAIVSLCIDFVLSTTESSAAGESCSFIRTETNSKQTTRFLSLL